jgi:glutamyl-tRNA synthetase
LGWAYGDQEIFSLEELIEKFSLEEVNPSAAIFDSEKLLWLNHHYIKTGDPVRLGRLMREYSLKKGWLTPQEAERIPDERWAEAVELFKERQRTLAGLAEAALPLLTERFSYDPQAVEKFLTSEKAPLLEGLTTVLEEMPTEDFTAAALEEKIRGYLDSQGRTLKEVAQPCRVAITGVTKGPGLFETMGFLGKERVIKRLKRAVSEIQRATSQAKSP